MDLVCRDSCFPEHDLVCPPQIHLILSVWLLVKQIVMVLLCKAIGKFRSHLRSYLKAVLADARSNAGNDIRRFCAVFPVHGLQCGFSHAVHRAPPAGMGQSDSPVDRIHKIQWHTVRVKSHQRDTRNIRDQAIYILIIPLFYNALSRVFLRHLADIGGVGLVGKHHLLCIGSENGCHAAVIFHYMLRIIIPGKAKVHGREHALADTSVAGGKGMAYQTGGIQSRKGQIGNAVFLTDFNFRFFQTALHTAAFRLSCCCHAALLVDGVCRIENIPQISDVTLSLKILEHLGAGIRVINRHTVEIDASRIRSTRTSYELARKMRASYYLIGSLLGRFGQAEVAMPGGCNFGVRPIDQHVKGFTALGAKVMVEGGFINASTETGRLKGANIYLDVVSVGATMNTMMAAVRAEGNTVIENAAKEPHIVDLANFLNSMGANIRGAGTDTIKIQGVDRLRGGSYAIIPDQIEAGTYMAAVAATGGQILVKNIIPKHMDCITAKLVEMGVEVEEREDTLLVRRSGPLQKANVKTMPYPGFPTDMQPQITTVLCLAEGTSLVTESVWNNRYRYVDELKRMGASIQVDDKTAVVEGVDHLTGAPIQACDLRAGAALVIAALAAKGESEISCVQYIERGYEDIVTKLQGLGASIRTVEVPGESEELEAHIG